MQTFHHIPKHSIKLVAVWSYLVWMQGLIALKETEHGLFLIPGTPRPTIYNWLFQLDDSQSLHRKWLEITKHLFINGCLGFQVYL